MYTIYTSPHDRKAQDNNMEVIKKLSEIGVGKKGGEGGGQTLRLHRFFFFPGCIGRFEQAIEEF